LAGILQDNYNLLTNADQFIEKPFIHWDKAHYNLSLNRICIFLKEFPSKPKSELFSTISFSFKKPTLAHLHLGKNGQLSRMEECHTPIALYRDWEMPHREKKMIMIRTKQTGKNTYIK
jgi:hypothetical protein